jgi:hypothetical protein
MKSKSKKQMAANDDGVVPGRSLAADITSAERLLALAVDNAASLEWKPGDGVEFQNAIDEVKASDGESKSARRITVQSTIKVRKSVRSLRGVRRKFAAAFRLANSAGLPIADLELFAAVAVGRQHRQLLAWVLKVRPIVSKFDKSLARWFGEDALAKLDALAAELASALSEQERALKREPVCTEKLGKARAELARLVTSLALRADVAFADQPDIRKLFRKHARAAKAAAGANAQETKEVKEAKEEKVADAA